MTFRDLHTGTPVHYLDKLSLQYEQAGVEAVGMPRYDTPKLGSTAITAGQVLDVTIKGTPYVVPCEGSIAYSDKVVFALERAQHPAPRSCPCSHLLQ